MKLSELTGNQFAELIVKIAAPADRIMADESISEIAVEYSKAKGAAKLSKLMRLSAALLGDHRADTFAVLAAINGKTVDEIADQTADKLLEDVKAAIESDILNFFK